mmetsp:Transcript_38216/g.80407  ORF Transcript_38216/g.80407 Transcript_38216/m.80407 type:complete len:104 (+) Transcript_38216:567-878(+)
MRSCNTSGEFVMKRPSPMTHSKLVKADVTFGPNLSSTKPKKILMPMEHAKPIVPSAEKLAFCSLHFVPQAQFAAKIPNFCSDNMRKGYPNVSPPNRNEFMHAR